VASDGAWREQAELPVEVTPAALSADGDTLLANIVDREVVYVRSGETWTQQAALGKPPPLGGEVDQALSADGNTAVVNYKEAGVLIAEVFTRSGETWSESARLIPVKTFHLGGCESQPVALSADGDEALVSDTCYAEGRGGVFVFTRSGTTWTRQALLRGSKRSEYFGQRIALSENGETAIIGTANGTRTFVRGRNRWVEQEEQVSGHDGVGCYIGPFALSGNGSTELILEGSNCPVKLDVFMRSGRRWTESETLPFREVEKPEAPPGSLVVSENGDTVLADQEFDYLSGTPIFRTTVWTR